MDYVSVLSKNSNKKQELHLNFLYNYDFAFSHESDLLRLMCVSDQGPDRTRVLSLFAQNARRRFRKNVKL